MQTQQNKGAISSPEQKTIQQFIAEHGLELSAQRIQSRKDIPSDTWSKDAFHYAVTISKGRSGMDFNYSMGSAHVDEAGRPKYPELPEVLDCLASDYAGYKNSSSFEGWASDHGYDPDSRKAESIYQLVMEKALELEDLIGIPACQELAFAVERL